MPIMRIKILREAKGMTQQALADALGVTQSVVGNWEAEIALPRARQIPALAEILGTTIDDLFDGREEAG